MSNNSINEYLSNPNLTVGEIVARNYNFAKVFSKYGIDFCCKGNRNLQKLISSLNIDRSTFVANLLKVEEKNTDERNYDTNSVIDLIDHIVSVHHDYLRENLPYIESLLEKVKNAHSKNHIFLHEVVQEFKSLKNEITNHLNREEETLFRVIRYLSDCQKFKEKPRTKGYKSMVALLGDYEREHQFVGSTLERIRNLTSNFSLPENACATFALCYQKLEELEKNTHRHVHLENNILFPKAIALEVSLN